MERGAKRIENHGDGDKRDGLSLCRVPPHGFAVVVEHHACTGTECVVAWWHALFRRQLLLSSPTHAFLQTANAVLGLKTGDARAEENGKYRSEQSSLTEQGVMPKK